MPDEKDKLDERARQLQELIDAPELPKPSSPHAFVQELIDADDLPEPTSPHAFVQDQMRKTEKARRAEKPAAPEPEKKED